MVVLRPWLLQPIAAYYIFWAGFAITIVAHGTIHTQTVDQANAANGSRDLLLEQDLGHLFEAEDSRYIERS
jgi:hypothetical protein